MENGILGGRPSASPCRNARYTSSQRTLQRTTFYIVYTYTLKIMCTLHIRKNVSVKTIPLIRTTLLLKVTYIQKKKKNNPLHRHAVYNPNMLAMLISEIEQDER